MDITKHCVMSCTLHQFIQCFWSTQDLQILIVYKSSNCISLTTLL